MASLEIYNPGKDVEGVTAASMQSLTSFQTTDGSDYADDKRRLYMKHKRHLSMNREKIIQASKLRRPANTPLNPFESDFGSDAAREDDKSGVDNSPSVQMSKSRARRLAPGLRLNLAAKASQGVAPDESPSSTPGLTFSAAPSYAGRLTPVILASVGSRDISERPRSFSLVDVAQHENRSTRFQKMLFKVELIKKPRGKKLGFTVVGGSDTPGRPMGIHVKTIQSDGLAQGLLNYSWTVSQRMPLTFHRLAAALVCSTGDRSV